jgi:UDP-N-acetylglucosamine--N-acetylmuramyl-(pentapeptide) pyrophosphoryl-undecaprenol N-acetylglucosamine transferase
MASHQAAIHLPQRDMTPPSVAELLMNFSRQELLAMAERARELAQPCAAMRVADEIERMVAP